MKKSYIVRLTDDERESCLAVVKKLKGSSQKVRRANILLKADIGGPNWTDQDIADAFFCSRQCVENVRKRLVTEGFDIALHYKNGMHALTLALSQRERGQLFATLQSSGCIKVWWYFFRPPLLTVDAQMQNSLHIQWVRETVKVAYFTITQNYCLGTAKIWDTKFARRSCIPRQMWRLSQKIRGTRHYHQTLTHPNPRVPARPSCIPNQSLLKLATPNSRASFKNPKSEIVYRVTE